MRRGSKGIPEGADSRLLGHAPVARLWARRVHVAVFLKFEVQFMQYILTISLVLFLIAWSIFGVWLVIKYGMLFGPHPDDPAETAGARSFGVAHVAAVWVGVFALATYFLFR